MMGSGQTALSHGAEDLWQADQLEQPGALRSLCAPAGAATQSRCRPRYRLRPAAAPTRRPAGAAAPGVTGCLHCRHHRHRRRRRQGCCQRWPPCRACPLLQPSGTPSPAGRQEKARICLIPTRGRTHLLSVVQVQSNIHAVCTCALLISAPAPLTAGHWRCTPATGGPARPAAGLPPVRKMCASSR
jgi:hypothetical protein